MLPLGIKYIKTSIASTKPSKKIQPLDLFVFATDRKVRKYGIHQQRDLWECVCYSVEAMIRQVELQLDAMSKSDWQMGSDFRQRADGLRL